MRTANLAQDLALALDAARLFLVTIGHAPDRWQISVLRSPARQLLLNCSRQAGKSTLSAVLALHAALYQPSALVLLCAPSLRQSQELFRKVKSAYAALALPAELLGEESALRLEFIHGSRIICLPGKEQTIRGFSSVSLLVVDEASRVSDELYRAIRPMLAVSGGRIVLLSTPFGRRGFFFEEWEHGGAAWERVAIPATAVPRISAAFLEEERRSLGFWYDQEYGCAFLDTTNQVFSYQDVMAAVSADVPPLFGG